MKAYFLDGPLATRSSEMTQAEEASMTVMINFQWAGIHQHTAQYFPAYEGTLAGSPVAIMTVRLDLDERGLINLIDEAMSIQLTGIGEQILADRTSLQLDSGILDTMSMGYIGQMARLNKRLLEIQNESWYRTGRGSPAPSPRGTTGRRGQPDGAK